MTKLSSSSSSSSSVVMATRPRIETTTVSTSLSLLVLKQLIEVSVSCITYIRGLFPEENYEVLGFAGANVKMLRRGFNEVNTRVNNIIEQGVFDALSRGYLRQMTMAIIADPATPDNVLECYHFKVSPSIDNSSQPSLDICNKDGTLLLDGEKASTVDGVKSQTLRMIRTLVTLVQTLSDLPAGCYLTFRIYYHDDRTPPSYIPPYFIDCAPTANAEFAFSTPPKVCATLGKIVTPHHRMKVDMKSLCDELQPTQQPARNSSIQKQSAGDQIAQLLAEAKITDKDKDVTRCVCGLPDEDSGMVECDVCKSWSHVVCWGYYHEKDSRLQSSPFQCHVCSKMPSVETLKMRELALFRTAVAVSWNEAADPEDTSEHWSETALARRMLIPRIEARKLAERIVQEQIGEWVHEEARPRRRTEYVMRKHNSSAKARVRAYFNANLKDAMRPKPKNASDDSAKASQIPQTQDTVILCSQPTPSQVAPKNGATKARKRSMEDEKIDKVEEIRDGNSAGRKRARFSTIATHIRVL